GDYRHRADLDARLAQLIGQAVVKRPAQSAGRGHRLHLGDGRLRPDSRSESGGSAQGLHLVDALPGEVVLVAAEMAVGSGLLVDRAVQFELLAKRARPQVEYLLRRPRDRRPRRATLP